MHWTFQDISDNLHESSFQTELDVVKCLTTKTFVLSLRSYLAHSIETAFLKTNLRCKEPKAAVFTRGNYQKNPNYSYLCLNEGGDFMSLLIKTAASTSIFTSV